jgi:hypothetical protein
MPTATTTHTLYLSCSGLVAMLRSGLVTAESLLSGDVLFAFGASRHAVMERPEFLVSHSRQPEKVDLLEFAIQPAVAAAESDTPARVIWDDPHTHAITYQELDAFLERQGHAPLPHEGRPEGGVIDREWIVQHAPKGVVAVMHAAPVPR